MSTAEALSKLDSNSLFSSESRDFRDYVAAEAGRLEIQGDDTQKGTVDRKLIKMGDNVALNVITLPEFKQQKYLPNEFFAALQEWEGVIRQIGDGKFYADLYDVSRNDDMPSQIAEIAFSDIDPSDIAKVQPGAVFRWLVGRSRTLSGRASGKWVIYFRPPSKVKQASIFDTMVIPESLQKKIDQLAE